MIYEREDFDFVDVSAIEVDGVFAPTRARNKKAFLYGEDVAWIVEGFLERTGEVKTWNGPALSTYETGTSFSTIGDVTDPLTHSSFGVNYLVTPCSIFRDTSRSKCISMLAGFDSAYNSNRRFHDWGGLFSVDHYVTDCEDFFEYLNTRPEVKITPLSASMSTDFSPLAVADIDTFFSDMTAAGTIMHRLDSGAFQVLGGVVHYLDDGSESTTPISGYVRPSWSYYRTWSSGLGRYIVREDWTTKSFDPWLYVSGVKRPNGTWTDPRVTTGSEVRAWVVFRVRLYSGGVWTYRYDAVSFPLEVAGDAEIEEGIPARSLMMPSSWRNGRSLGNTVLGHLNVTATDYEQIHMDVHGVYFDAYMRYRASLN